MKELLRKLPSVDEMLNNDKIKHLYADSLHVFIREACVKAIEVTRKKILAHDIKDFDLDDIISLSIKILENDNKEIRRIINATGVILHTNLGRALLSDSAIKAICENASSYSNLEFDINTKSRGSRYDSVKRLLLKLSKAEDAIVVNNNAAALMLILASLSKNKNVIISRGELVEIGGSFRVPDVIVSGGALLREVGTTNKTKISDYENEIDENTAILLHVHNSNFRIKGFTEKPELKEIVNLGNKHDIPVVSDLGSGAFFKSKLFQKAEEPTISEILSADVDLLCFSGDKLLGGPQAGIILGKKEYIDKIKNNQLLRALRIDKLSLIALEATLKDYFDETSAYKNIPTLRMLNEDSENVKKRAEKLLKMLDLNDEKLEVEIIKTFSEAGGGTMPDIKIDSYAIAIKPLNISVNDFENILSKAKTPIIARIFEGKYLMDLRTIEEKDFTYIVNTISNLA